MSSGVRCLTKTGLPLHLNTAVVPSAIGRRSTSVVPAASISYKEDKKRRKEEKNREEDQATQAREKKWRSDTLLCRRVCEHGVRKSEQSTASCPTSSPSQMWPWMVRQTGRSTCMRVVRYACLRIGLLASRLLPLS